MLSEDSMGSDRSVARHHNRRLAGRRLVGSVARICLVIGVVWLLYAAVPLDGPREGTVLTRMVLSLLVLAAIVTWQIAAVARSLYPGLRAVEAVAVSIPLLIALFASAYVVTSNSDNASFTEPLTKPDGVYFAVTVLATVGFGDIAPRSEAARYIVTMQMVVDLVLIGVIAKVLFGAAQERRRALGAKVEKV